jgi:hypothetical protein
MKKILGNILPYVLTETNSVSQLLSVVPTVRHRVSIPLADLLQGGISHIEATGSSILTLTRGTIQTGAMALKNRVAGIADLLTV